MAGVKGRTGLHGRQGRTATSVRPLADQINNLFEVLSQKYPGLTLQAEHLEIERCPGCGCISWQPYEITANNSEFEVIGREQVAGHPAQHAKNCSTTRGTIRFAHSATNRYLTRFRRILRKLDIFAHQTVTLQSR